MSTWILIILVINFQSAPTITSIEFQSKERCDAAATAFKDRTDRNDIGNGNRPFTQVLCVKQ